MKRFGNHVNDHAKRKPRRGVTAVETAITLLVFSTLVLGVMDLSMLVFQTHTVNHLAREAARLAIVHGEDAPTSWDGGPWGPAAYGPVTLGSAGGAIAQAVKDKVVTLDPAQTKITVTWPDGDNSRGSRVHILVTTKVNRLTGMFTGNSTLEGESTMLISH